MRKGQVTTFIIIGILILIVMGSFYYFLFLDTDRTMFEASLREAGSSESQRKVQNYVQECLDMASVEGVEILRAQGGYINFPDGINTLKTPSDVTIYEDNGKHIKKEKGNIKLPYYLVGDEIRIPSLSFMTRELEDYIESQVNECTGDFGSFNKEGINVSKGIADVTVSLKDDVLINLNFPIEGSKEKSNFYLNNFSKEVPLNIPRIHNYLVDLVFFEIQNKYLEKHANNIISMYQYQGGEKQDLDLPPKIHVETNLDCSFETWSISEIEEDLKTLFESYYSLVRFGDTLINNTEFDSTDIFYNTFVKNYFPEDKEMSIDLSFNPEDPFELSVESPTGSLTPFRISQTDVPFLPQICVFKYIFKYDVEMPVMFTLTDYKSNKIDAPYRISNKKGAVWRFYTDVLLYGNQNRVENNIMDKYVGIGELIAEKNNINLEDYGYGKNHEYYNFSDERRTVFIIKNSRTKKPLNGVNVEYSCGGESINSRFFGRTNKNGELQVVANSCNNNKIGNITLHKEGYTAKAIGLNYFFDQQPSGSTDDDFLKEYTFEFFMEEEKVFDIKFRVLHLPTFVRNYYMTYGFKEDSCTGQTKEQLLKDSYLDISSKDEATYSIKGKDSKKLYGEIYYYPYTDNLSLSKGQYEVSISFRGEVTIKPGKYTINGKTTIVDLDNNPLTTVNYKGKFDLGNIKYDYYFSPISTTKEILFIAPVNFYKNDDVNVLNMSSGPLQMDGSIKEEISLDRNCNGVNENVVLLISKKIFYDYIKPELK